ncbi:MAG: hypothetical protein ABIH76_08075, partial [Candidatus Bathyarchaeota archaeon]
MVDIWGSETQLFENYCLLTGGNCPFFSVEIKNDFFISEPYDAERQQRESAIQGALQGFSYIIADKDVMNIALTCKVCQEIQSSQFGIVDITNFNYNVLIELGMLYGYNKPVVIIVKKDFNLQYEIPSNIIGIE